MKRLILLLAGLLAIFSLSACNSFDCDQTETSDGAYICIGIDGMDAARTIAPTFNVAELSGFSLYGRKTAEDDWTSFMWYNNTYEDLLNSTVAIKTGTWYEFKLTADSNKGHGTTYFVGTISNKEIVKGKNTLNFTLMLDDERNSNNSCVNVTFKIPSATAVKKAKAGLYDVESDELYDYGYSSYSTLSITPSEDSDTATAVYNYSSWTLSKDTYRLKAWFYADEECTLLVSTFCELVKVLDGITTWGERDIDKLNPVYTITLNNASYKENFTPKTLYTRYEGVKLPKSEEMFKSGYTFMGWYRNADGSGEPITEIPSTQAENVVLYAKWLEGYWLTADTWEIYSRRGFDGLEEISIHLVGEWTNENFSKFVHGSSELWNEKKSISLDMSQSTGITEIKNKVFYTSSSHYCLGLVSVKLPAGVTSIGDYAFHDCKSLKSIELPESLTSIGEHAFSGCSSLKNTDLPEDLTIIGDEAFEGCSSLEEIDLPLNLTTIGRIAFCMCTSLKNIELPEGTTTIKEGAFSGCKSLVSAIINSKIESIPEHMFSYCEALSTIKFSDSITSIETDAFYKTNKLKSVTIGSGLISRDYESKKNLSDLFPVCEILTISDGVEKIGKYVFENCKSLKSVSFPASLKEISAGAFESCTSLESVIIPEGVTKLSSSTFAGCSSLETVRLPDSLKEMSSSFKKCTSLTTVNIPAGVTSLSHTFSGCTSLTTVNIPAGVTNLDYTFFGCTSLTTINIPDGVTDLTCTFVGCSSLETVRLPDSLKEMSSSFEECTSLTTVNIPAGVTNLDYTFLRCTSLTTVNIPDGVTDLHSTFYGCTSLTTVNIPDGVTDLDCTFLGCTSLTTINIPAGVTSLRETFSGCTSLTSVNIPEGVTVFGEETFRNCSALTKLAIPESVKTINVGAFYNCSSLKTLIIPIGVKELGKSGEIGGILESRSGRVFSGCSSLEDITILGKITKIGICDFEGCSSLKKIVLPDTITSIGTGAFSGCTSLTAITLPDAVTSIDSDAFADCIVLESITIPRSISKIGKNAFKSAGLKEATFLGEPVFWHINEEKYLFDSAMGIVFSDTDKAFNANQLTTEKVNYYLCRDN